MLDKFENGDKIIITKPQRRAILHLKSQKRKIKDKNKDKVMTMLFLSIHLHKRSEAYHQTNRSNKRHIMGNGYWEWIIGEWSLTCFIGDRSLTWRTKISFRRINFPSSTSLPWKVAHSRSSSPPPLSHRLVCLSHHLVCFSHYLVRLSHHLVRLSHDFARLSSQHLVRLSLHLVRFIHYFVRLSQNLARLSDYLVHFLSLSRHLKCLHTF